VQRQSSGPLRIGSMMNAWDEETAIAPHGHIPSLQLNASALQVGRRASRLTIFGVCNHCTQAPALPAPSHSASTQASTPNRFLQGPTPRFDHHS
jgi:hypothetical protein